MRRKGDDADDRPSVFENCRDESDCGDCDTCGDVCQTAAQENAQKFYLCALACGGISSRGSVHC